MSTQAGVVSVGITADASQYLQQMLQVQRTTRNATEDLVDLMRAQLDAGNATEKTASSAKEGAGAWTEFASSLSVVKDVSGWVKDGVMAMVDAANSVSASGAIEWNAAMRKLNDQVTTAEASIGELLRPAVMAVVGALTQLANLVARIDWKRLSADAKLAFGDVWHGIQDVAKTISSAASSVLDIGHSLAVTAARILLSPFQLLQNAIAAALAGVLDVTGIALSKLGALLDATGLGDRFKQIAGVDLGGLGARFQKAGAAAATTANGLDIGKQFVSFVEAGAKELGSQIGSGLKEVLVTNPGSYLKAPGDVVTKHAWNATDTAAAGIERAVAEMNQKFGEQALKSVVMANNSATVAAKLGEQSAANQAAIAAQGAETAHATLAQAYAQGNAGLIASSQQAYDQAMAEVASRRAAASDAAESLALAAQTAAQSLAERAQAARADAEAAEARYQKAALNAERIGPKGAQGERAKNEMEAAKLEADLKLKTSNTLFEQTVAAAQKAGELGLTAQKSKDDQALKAAQERFKKELEAQERLYRQQKAGTDAVGRLAGVGNFQGAYSSMASTGIGNIKASDTTDLGPLGKASTAGIVGVVIELIAMSKQFQAIGGAIKEIIQAVANVMGAMSQPILDILVLLKNAVVPTLAALEPAIAAFAELTSPVLMVLKLTVAPLGDLATSLARVTSAVMPLVPPLVKLTAAAVLLVSNIWQIGLLAELLSMAINAVAPIIENVTTSISMAWNGLVQKLSRWVRSFDDIPVIGPLFDKMADATEGLLIPIQSLATASVGASTALDQMASKINSSFGNFFEAMDKARGIQAAATQAAAFAAAHPGDANAQAVAAEMAKAATQAWQQTQQASDQYLIDKAQAAVAAAQSSGYGPGSNTYDTAYNALLAAYGQQAMDLAKNSASTEANTKATNALNGILNAPQGFKLEGYQYGAIGARSAMDAGAVGSAPMLAGGRSQVQTFTGDIHLHIDLDSDLGPDQVADQLAKALQKLTFRRTGTLAPQFPGGRFSTTGQS